MQVLRQGGGAGSVISTLHLSLRLAHEPQVGTSRAEDSFRVFTQFGGGGAGTCRRSRSSSTWAYRHARSLGELAGEDRLGAFPAHGGHCGPTEGSVGGVTRSRASCHSGAAGRCRSGPGGPPRWAGGPGSAAPCGSGHLPGAARGHGPPQTGDSLGGNRSSHAIPLPGPKPSTPSGGTHHSRHSWEPPLGSLRASASPSI